VAVVEQPPKGGDGVTVCRDSIITCIHMAVLSACYACAQHVAVWSALMRPRLCYYLWYDHALFVLYILCCHVDCVLYMQCCDLCMRMAARDDIGLCHVRLVLYDVGTRAMRLSSI
jgi:hypothetical protein